MSFVFYAPPEPDCEGVPRAFRGCGQGPREQAPPKDVQAAPVVGSPLRARLLSSGAPPPGPSTPP
jgi:hypothetical protein